MADTPRHDDSAELDARIRGAWGELTDDDHVRGPGPEAAWEGIALAVGIEPAGRPAEPPGPPPWERSAAGEDAAPPAPTELRPSRRRPPLGWVVGLAAGLLVGVVAGSALQRASDVDPPVVYRAALTTDDIDAPPGFRGAAELRADDDATRLDLELDDVPDLAADEVLEVWLIDPEGGGLQSLGLTDGAGTLVVPAGLDTDRFSVVDVSVEPTDGDPTHSTRSVVRGPLEPTETS